MLWISVHVFGAEQLLEDAKKITKQELFRIFKVTIRINLFMEISRQHCNGVASGISVCFPVLSIPGEKIQREKKSTMNEFFGTKE